MNAPLPADQLVPDWDECMEKHDAGEQLSALERFVFDWEPAGRKDDEWREQLAAVIREAKAMRDRSAWQPIEAAPTDSAPVLIYTSYGKMATAYYAIYDERGNGTWFDWMRPNHSYGSVTHWMPLPEAQRS